MSEPDGAPETKSDERPVARDSTFVRLIADHVIVVDLGRDFEFAFIAVGNPIVSIESVENTEANATQKVVSRAELTETGRVRISPFTALNTAMNTLSKLVAKGLVETSALREGIEEMITSAPAPLEEDDV